MIPAEEQAQRRTALRALLAKPLLVADTDSETLILVRRHLTELREWLNRETGWRLVGLRPADFASGIRADSARVIRDLFSKRDGAPMAALTTAQRLSPEAADERFTRIRALIARVLGSAYIANRPISGASHLRPVAGAPGFAAPPASPPNPPERKLRSWRSTARISSPPTWPPC